MPVQTEIQSAFEDKNKDLLQAESAMDALLQEGLVLVLER